MAMGAAPAHIFPTAVQPLLLRAATPAAARDGRRGGGRLRSRSRPSLAATKTPLPTTSDLDVQLQVELTYIHTTVTE
jgi:hypothetical protein